MTYMEDNTEKKEIKPKGKKLFQPGCAPGPGRPLDTPAKKIEKKAIKLVAEEYMQKLSELMALEGMEILNNLSAIAKNPNSKSAVNAAKELHDRFMGKAPQSINVSKTPDFTFEDDLIVE